MRRLAFAAAVLGLSIIAFSQTTRTSPPRTAATTKPRATSLPTTTRARLNTLKVKAEEAMRLGSVERRAVAADIFDYADALAEAGLDEDAMSWYEKGLSTQAWDLPHQLAYAQLLKSKGRETQANERAKLVAETAEQGQLVVAALKLMGRDAEADESLPPLEKISDTGPAVVLITTGDVDVLLLKQVHKQLESRFAFPLYLRKADVKLPPPGADPYQKLMDGIRKGVTGRPENAPVLEHLGYTAEDMKDDQKLLDFMRKLGKAQGGPDAVRQFDAMCQSAKAGPKQWDASELIQAVSKVGEPMGGPHLRCIGITGLDITKEGANYLFASQQGQCGIVSYRRFMSDIWGGEVPSRTKLADRLAKQCTSSIGRTFGIMPCGNPTCVAAYPNSVEELDAKTGAFCPACQKKLEETIAQEKKQ